jgi:hypothetical protein
MLTKKTCGKSSFLQFENLGVITVFMQLFNDKPEEIYLITN